MNKVILMGRLTRDPEVRYSAGNNSMAVARYTLQLTADSAAMARTNADFIGCVAFGKSAEFAEKYLRQGTKIIVTGRIQTGSYTNRDGQKVYMTDVVVEDQEFAESKAAASEQRHDAAVRTVAVAASPMPSPAPGFLSRWIYEYSGRN